MNDVVKLQKENDLLRDRLAQQETHVKLLEEKLRLMMTRKFAASSEKSSPDQYGLFNEAEDEAAVDIIHTDEITIQSHQRKQKPLVSIPKDLPREDIIHDIPDADKVCPHDGSVLEVIGSDDHEQLDIIPAQIKVLRHRRLKYACPCCDQHIVVAKNPTKRSKKVSPAQAYSHLWPRKSIVIHYHSIGTTA